MGWVFLLFFLAAFGFALHPVKLTAKKDLSFGSFTFVIGGLLCSVLLCSALLLAPATATAPVQLQLLLAAPFTVGPSAKTIRIRSAAAASSSSLLLSSSSSPLSSFASANAFNIFTRALVKS